MQINNDFLNQKQQNYIDFVFNHAGIEPAIQESITSDVWQAVTEALECISNDNDVVREFRERGNIATTTSKKLEPFVVSPTDLVEFCNFIVSYILYQHDVNKSQNIFYKYDVPDIYNNYYDRAIRDKNEAEGDATSE